MDTNKRIGSSGHCMGMLSSTPAVSVLDWEDTKDNEGNELKLTISRLRVSSDI